MTTLIPRTQRHVVAPEKRATHISYIDARGPRFSATLTFIVLAVALVTQSTWVIAFQLIVFASAAFFGPPKGIYGRIYRGVIQPRLKGPVPSEDVRPVRFAQIVGLIFAGVALLGSLSGISAIFTIATAFALAAAFHNAFFNFCLGCEAYLLIQRLIR